MTALVQGGSHSSASSTSSPRLGFTHHTVPLFLPSSLSQISPDLLSFAGDEATSLEGKLAAVRKNVEAVQAVIQREKDEEIGEEFEVKINLEASKTVFFQRKDGQMVLVPHYPAVHKGGEVSLNTEEYDEFAWVSLSELLDFEPKIPNVTEMSIWAQGALKNASY